MNQVKKNLLFNIISLLVNVAIGILYTPYLVKSLGVVAYGVVPLALIINQYISVVTGSLTSALTRFYSIALQKGNKEEASQYLSTSIVVVLGLILVLAAPVYFLIQNIDGVFTIPDNLIEETKYLFSFSVFAFFCSLFSSVFNITLYAFNRLDLLNLVKIIRVSGKLVFVFILFTFLEKNIAYVGIANFITEVVLLLYSIIVFYKFSKGKVELRLKYYSRLALSSISVLAFWVIIQQLGDTGLYRIDNVLVNMFWSSKESGILGAFTELGNYSMIVVSVLGSLFGPVILIAYSKGEHEKVQEISLNNSLIVGVLSAVMVGVLCGFSPIILKLWVGDEFVLYKEWLIIKLALVPFYSAAGVFAFSARAWNKVRFPALMTVILGCLNFVFLYIIAEISKNNLNYVNYMLIMALVLGLIQSYFLNGLYFAKLYPGNTIQVIVNFFKILVVFVSAGAISHFLIKKIEVYSDAVSLVLILVTGIILLLISVSLVFNKKQKMAVKALIYK